MEGEERQRPTEGLMNRRIQRETEREQEKGTKAKTQRHWFEL